MSERLTIYLDKGLLSRVREIEVAERRPSTTNTIAIMLEDAADEREAGMRIWRKEQKVEAE